MVSLNGRSILRRMDLRRRLLRDSDASVPLDANRTLDIVAAKKPCSALHQDEIDDRRIRI
jgi:hypothetical protein